MSTETIERELQELKHRVERLEERMKPVAKPSWRDAFGMFQDDDLSREAERLGAEWRASANKKK